MECFFEFFLQIFGEAILQAIAEWGAVGVARFFRTLFADDPDDTTTSPQLGFAKTIAWQAVGAATGFLSLLIFPTHMLKTPLLRVLNLIFTPVAIALSMSAWRHFQKTHDKPRSPLTRIACSYGFALCFAIVRFFWAK